MATSELARILCVDDEPNVLDGIGRHLRQRYELFTATSGQEGLDTLQTSGPFAVVISDLRMPGMDGIAFLSRVREKYPDTVRVLLTGNADLDAAIAVVNKGHVFRFLSKPCPSEDLHASLAAAVEQHALVTAERVLLEQTLHGCIKMLTDILALTNPEAFGRAVRAKKAASLLVGHLGVPDGWQVDVAAMLSQIGCVTLPDKTAEKLYNGQSLTDGEQVMVDRLPRVVAEIVGNIPRMEAIAKILAYQHKRFDGSGLPHDGVNGEAIPIGARILKVVLDFDVLESRGLSAGVALDTLQSRADWYDSRVLGAFVQIHGNAPHEVEVREITLRDVRPGMVFVTDVRNVNGLLLIARGQEATTSLLERLRNYTKGVDLGQKISTCIPGTTVNVDVSA